MKSEIVSIAVRYWKKALQRCRELSMSVPKIVPKISSDSDDKKGFCTVWAICSKWLKMVLARMRKLENCLGRLICIFHMLACLYLQMQDGPLKEHHPKVIKFICTWRLDKKPFNLQKNYLYFMQKVIVNFNTLKSWKRLFWLQIKINNKFSWTTNGVY